MDTHQDAMDQYGRQPISSNSERNLLPPERSRDIAELLKLMGDPIRLQVLDILVARGEHNVTELKDATGVKKQPALSHHLALLRGAGLISLRRQGKHNFYFVPAGDIRQFVENIIDFWVKVTEQEPSDAAPPDAVQPPDTPDQSSQ